MKKIWMGALLLISLAGQSQSADSALLKLAEAVPAEKMYIHYDKDYYLAGETVFFKAYLFHDGLPSSLSSNFYMQLVNAEGKIISALHLPVNSATVKGSLDLPDTLSQGIYYIRAVTPAELNLEEELIYKKALPVYNPLNKSAAVSKMAPDLSLRFFPESGAMLDGVLTTFAFQAVNEYGLPADVSGSILTSDGTTIAPFKSYHDGIGRMQFKPVAGKKYVAQVDFNGGIRSYPLPETAAAGVYLKVLDEKDGKQFQLWRVAKDPSQYAEVKLVAAIENHIVYDVDVAFDNYPSVVGHLLTNELPSGILKFTVFSSDGLPLAERLSFVNNNEYRDLPALQDVKVNTGKRASSSVQIVFPDSAQRSCSVSVIDAAAGDELASENMYSRLLLTSDIRGNVHNPGWYLQAGNDSTKQGTDNLLLTHGWSRYSWTKILKGEFPQKKYLDETLIHLSGKVVDPKTKAAVANGKLSVYMEAADSSSYTYEFPVDASGHYSADSILFYGTGNVFYAYVDKDGRNRPGVAVPDSGSFDQNAQALQKNFFAGMDRSPSGMPQDLTGRAMQLKADAEIYKELQKVELRTKGAKRPIDLVNEKYTSGVFRTPGKVELDNINEPSNDKSMSVVDYFLNRIQALELQGGRLVNRRNFSLQSGQKWSVGVFLDEELVDLNLLRTKTMKDIALVKFYDAGFVGVGSTYPGGAVAVYTKERNESDPKAEKLQSFTVNGYSVTREFYQPPYAQADFKAPAADNRSTLYWNPDVLLNKDKLTIPVQFFNNDHGKSFKIIVEGFNGAGKMIHLEKVITQ